MLEYGLQALPPDQLSELADRLEDRSVESGLAAPSFVAQALRIIDALFEASDEAGGIREGFVRMLDVRIRERVAEIQRGDPLTAAAKARSLREEMRSMVAGYDVRQRYE